MIDTKLLLNDFESTAKKLLSRNLEKQQLGHKFMLEKDKTQANELRFCLK